jgi:hypothetical protein
MEEIKRLAAELANTILYEGKNPLPENITKDNARYLLGLIDGHVEPPKPSVEQQVQEVKSQILAEIEAKQIKEQAIAELKVDPSVDNVALSSVIGVKINET